MEANEVKMLIYAISLTLLLLGVFLLLFFVSYKKKQITHRQKIAELKEELLRTQIEIQEQTLTNVSQEIHDNIGQTLSLVKLNLNTLDPAKPNWEEKKRVSKDLVGKAIQDLRNLSKTLHSDTILSAGLFKAIEYELSLIQASGAGHTALHISGQPGRPDGDKELILFRIVQEALNNIIKHANATLISVKIWADDETLYLLVADDGTGFDPALQKGGMEDGSGLRNMHSRAQLIGGSCKVRSALNRGTQIELHIPYTSK